jgi:hypothetical protein
MNLPDQPKTCSVETCDRPVLATGLCRAHYQRRREHVDVLPDIPVGAVRRGSSLRHEVAERHRASPEGVGLKAPDRDLRGDLEAVLSNVFTPKVGIYPSIGAVRRWYVWSSAGMHEKPRVSRPFATLHAARRYLRGQLGTDWCPPRDVPVADFLPRYVAEAKGLKAGVYWEDQTMVYVVSVELPGMLGPQRGAIVTTDHELAHIVANGGLPAAQMTIDAVKGRDRAEAAAAIDEMMVDAEWHGELRERLWGREVRHAA